MKRISTLNGLYIHVVSESASRDIEATSHPVENGLPVTDTVKAGALSISLSGKIVDYDGMKAIQVMDKIRSWQSSGALIAYRGRNTADSMQIRSFRTEHPNTINGGADFSLELAQVRIAQSAYAPKPTTGGVTTDEQLDPSTIKVGDRVIFRGGPVYVSSDAKKRAATRGRSTCKVNIINTRSWSLHSYDLESIDGQHVSGWCDIENIERGTQTSTAGTTNAGTQQVTSGTSAGVYHTVKRGDTVYALATRQYKHLGKSPEWVMENNPGAFSTPGDCATLQIGSKLLMGYRS